MRHRRARVPTALAGLLAALLALAACGPLPRPFKPEGKSTNELLLLSDRAGMAVASVTGAVADGQALAEAMAAALRRENVPASVAVGNRQSRWLLGHAEALDAPAGEVRRRLVWELYDAEGALIGEVERTAALSAQAWRRGDPEALARVAAATAPAIAAMVQGPRVVESQLPGYPAGTSLVVQPVAGGPPAFARALTRAMAERLRRQGLPLADRAQPGDVVVRGTLDLGPETNGQRSLDLRWTLQRQGREGTLGDLRQANAVSAERLAQQPDALAGLIVRAALPGVRRVLESGRP